MKRAFELKFRIRKDHPGYTGQVHKMAFEAPDKQYLIDSIDTQFEIISCVEIPHPGEAPEIELVDEYGVVVDG